MGTMGYDWIRENRERLSLTQKELADKAGLTRKSIVNYETGQREPRAKIERTLKEILLGSQGVQKGESPPTPPTFFNNQSESFGGYWVVNVPMIPIKAKASYVTDHVDATFIQELKHVPFLVKQQVKGNYFAFEVSGDSMECDSERSIPETSIVLTRELGREHWRDKLHTNKYPFWIIVTKTDILCKQIIAQDLETGTITCHSLNESNPQYQDFDLKLDDIQQLCNIVKIQKDPV